MARERATNHPDDNDDSTTMTGRGEEMAFVILEDCKVAVVVDEKVKEAITTSCSVPVGQWIDVDLPGDEIQSVAAAAAAAAAPGVEESNSSKEPSEQHCELCELTLHHQRCTTSDDDYGGVSDGVVAAAASSHSLRLYMDRVGFFAGDSKNSKQQPATSCSCCGKRRLRTDASRLVGLLKTCHPVSVITTCRIFFWDETRRRAALVLTLAFPGLNGPVGCRSILREKNRILSPVVQAALSIIRSDWEFLDLFVAGMERMFALKRLPKETAPSIFPNELTLEEMYSRVNGSLVMQELQTNRHHLWDRRPQRDDCHLARLSKETLADHLAPFLASGSLNALRCTCSYMHTALRAVVPGLKLRLYHHQIRSLCWMRTREATSLVERDLLGLACSSPHAIHGDAHRAATCGLTTMLQPRPGRHNHSLSNGAALSIRIYQLTGQEVDPSLKTASFARNVARGGLLCDDPGLGKTITVLSLLLQTAGMTPSLATQQGATSNNNDNNTTAATLDDSEECLFHEYWRESYMVADLRRQPLLKLFNSFAAACRLARRCALVQSIQKAIDRDVYGADFRAFERGVENSIVESSFEEEYIQVLIDTFRGVVAEFKKGECTAARKAFSSAQAKPNSRVAALIEQNFRTKYLKSLSSTKATLLVVPAVLLDHWEAQIRMHIDFNYLTSKQPLIVSYDGNPKKLSEVWKLIRTTHSPILFIDRAGTKPLPSPELLVQFQFVITTNQRFANEWRNGSFQEEIRREDMGRDDTPTYALDPFSPDSSKTVCPLLKIYWHRLVVDEGHTMGRDRINSGIEFASWISSERRWAMSGTPTKQGAAQIGQIKALLRFLRHDFFSKRCEGDAFWKTAVAQYFKRGSVAGFFRLRQLLQLLMKRHTKMDIEELPPPLLRHSVIPMSFVECNTYNTIVAGIQSNLLLTSMEGRTSGKQDSLLHRNNARHAREALSNIRKVCVGWSRVLPTLTDKSWKETIDAAEATLNEKAVDRIRKYLHHAETEGLTECSCCGLRLSTLLIMSCCGSLVCAECMDSKSTQCLECGDEFDVDEFQRFQPGLFLTWKSNIKAKKKAGVGANGAVAPPPAPEAPEQQQQQQPGGGNNLAIIPHQQPREIVRRRTRKFGDGHTCVFIDESRDFAKDRKCLFCREEHQACNFVNDAKRCETCGKRAEQCDREESKAYYIVTKFLELLNTWPRRKVEHGDDRPLKVIVFSQFRQALNCIGNTLVKRFGDACVAEHFGKARRHALNKFTRDQNCFCLLLTKDGSEGLDLSFVTHIFFTEEIWDKSLADQAIARAWRMGAKGRVVVETLIAQNTVEEEMRELDQSADDNNPSTRMLQSLSRSDQEKTKTEYLLKSLRFVTDYHHFSARSTTADEEADPGTTPRTSKRQVPTPSSPDDAVNENEPANKKPRTKKQLTFRL